MGGQVRQQESPSRFHAPKVVRFQARISGDASKHSRTDLFAIMESENVVGISLAGQDLGGTGLALDDMPRLARSPSAHAADTVKT